MADKQVNQDRHPNFRSKGRLFLVRCFACGGERGTENYSCAVASGQCSWCGWAEAKTNNDEDEDGS